MSGEVTVLAHTVQHSLPSLQAKFDGNLLTTFKVIAKNTAYFFVDSVYITRE